MINPTRRKASCHGKRTVVVSCLEGKLVDIARNHSGLCGDAERDAYRAVEQNNGGPVYESVVVRHLLELVEKLAEGVRIARKSDDIDRVVMSPDPKTIGDLKMGLAGHCGTDLRMGREMLIGEDRKVPALSHVTVDKLFEMLKEFEDATPIRMLGKDGRKCWPPRPRIVKKGDNPYHLEIP